MLNLYNNMIFQTIDIKYVIIFLVCFVVVSFVLFIFCSYIIFKFLKINFDNNNVFFYKYNKTTQKILDLYGEYKLTKIYLIRQPFSQLVTFALNIFTLYNYRKLINKSQDNFPYHTLVVFEIKLPNGMKKLGKSRC